jgi:hypothetical protein
LKFYHVQSSAKGFKTVVEQVAVEAARDPPATLKRRQIHCQIQQPSQRAHALANQNEANANARR